MAGILRLRCMSWLVSSCADRGESPHFYEERVGSASDENMFRFSSDEQEL